MKLIQIAAISAAVSILTFGCQKKIEKKVSYPPTPATLAKAEGKNVRKYIDTLGTISSLHSVNVVPQVSGQIVKINFKQGQHVNAGDVLAEIDSRPYEAAVLQAQGSLRQAEAQLKIDSLDVERNKKLAKDNYIDKQTFDTLVAKVEVDKGIVETCKAALMTAQINLDWCKIKSPISGKVGLYNINSGNVVAAGSSIITTIEQVDNLYVDFVVPSQSLYDVKRFMESNGGKTHVDVSYIENNLGNRKTVAEVDIILNKIRYESGTAILRGKLDNKDGLFWPNQPVKVRVNLEEQKDAVLIPNICIQIGPKSHFVYVATPYKDGVYIIKQTDVEEGQLFDNDMRAVTGVKAGEFVVKNTSNLRLQAGPFVYAATPQGLIIGADSKPIIDPAKMREFMVNATKVADELRAKFMKQAAEAAAKKQAPIEALKAAEKAASGVK
ncbi:MAG TPA: efflux RND transporter periplasmic adaptor subunit [Candidatus Merdousia gallistercoris]|nr:efflux RND transporter periplasmic adaptor subunit [Candidatus Merdousia gallistercoris]